MNPIPQLPVPIILWSTGSCDGIPKRLKCEQCCQNLVCRVGWVGCISHNKSNSSLIEESAVGGAARARPSSKYNSIFVTSTTLKPQRLADELVLIFAANCSKKASQMLSLQPVFTWNSCYLTSSSRRIQKGNTRCHHSQFFWLPPNTYQYKCL